MASLNRPSGVALRDGRMRSASWAEKPRGHSELTRWPHLTRSCEAAECRNHAKPASELGARPKRQPHLLRRGAVLPRTMSSVGITICPVPPGPPPFNCSTISSTMASPAR